MSNFKLNRRQFVSSTGAMFLLPLFESLISNKALAQAAADPRRFVCFYFPNGPYNRKDLMSWSASAGPLGVNTNYGAVFSPFAANASDFTVLNGITNKVADSLVPGAGSGHVSCVTYLTGANVNPNSSAKTLASTVNSVDQVIAKKFGKSAWVLNGGSEQPVIGAGEPFDSFAHWVSFNAGVGQLGLCNPGDIYRQMISQITFGTATPTPTPTPNKSKSILDSALVDLNQLRQMLGQNDQRRLDEYMAGLRALETSSAATVPVVSSNAACVKPSLDPAVDKAVLSQAASGSMEYYNRFRAFNDLIKIAFACDLVRTVAIMMDFEAVERPNQAAANSSLIYNGADCNEYKHSMSHASAGSVQARDRVITRDRSYLSLVFDLVTKLKGVSDPSGSTLLDNTVIMAGHGIADGNHEEYLAAQRTVMLAGGRNFLKPGNSVDARTMDQRDLLYTIQSHLGGGLTSFAGSSKLLGV